MPRYYFDMMDDDGLLVWMTRVSSFPIWTQRKKRPPDLWAIWCATKWTPLNFFCSPGTIIPPRNFLGELRCLRGGNSHASRFRITQRPNILGSYDSGHHSGGVWRGCLGLVRVDASVNAPMSCRRRGSLAGLVQAWTRLGKGRSSTRRSAQDGWSRS